MAVEVQWVSGMELFQFVQVTFVIIPGLTTCLVCKIIVECRSEHNLL